MVAKEVVNWRFIGLVLWTLIIFIALLAPIPDAPVATLRGFRHWDKVAHFGLFAITGLVSLFGATFLVRFRTRMLFATVFTLSLAVSTELVQSLLAFRSASVLDLVADIAGLGVALVTGVLLHHKLGRYAR